MRPGEGFAAHEFGMAAERMEAIAPAVRGRVARRRRARLASRWLRMLLVATPMVAALAALSPEANGPAPVADPLTTSALAPRRAAVPAANPEGDPLAGSAPALALEGSDWPAQTITTSLRRNPATGAREDAVAAGDFAGAGRHLQVALARGGDEGSRYLALARRAAAVGKAVVKAVPANAVPTRFGPAQTTALVLESGGVQRACTGFRVARPQGGLHLEGWLCGADALAPRDEELACALSDLVLAPATDEAALRAAFAEADRTRLMGCRAGDRAGLAPRRARGAPGR